MAALSPFQFKKFFQKLYERAFDADILSRAAQVAFYFSFALFPLLYFLVSLFGLWLEASEGLRGELFSYLRRIMPFAVFDLVRTTVDEIIEKSSGGKLVLGLIVALWSASAGVDAVRSALNDVYKLKETRSIWRLKIESLLLTFAIAILTTLILAIVFYGWQLFGAGLAMIGLEVSSPLVLVSIQWITILLAMLLACEMAYNLLPDFKKFSWVWVTPGSIVAIVLWIVLTSGFRVYLGYFNTYNRAYGSLGAVMIMMLWLYLTALALIIGGAINAIYNELRQDKPKVSEHA
jgi:membrane protein